MKELSIIIEKTRKILQKNDNITELLNICYICMNTIDHSRKKE
jgi:hypothetical protein